MPARSTLEEMLESLKQRDKKPADVPPALPQRPLSKARLPSMNRIRKGISAGNGNDATGLPQFRQAESSDSLSVESIMSSDNAKEPNGDNGIKNSLELVSTVANSESHKHGRDTSTDIMPSLQSIGMRGDKRRKASEIAEAAEAIAQAEDDSGIHIDAGNANAELDERDLQRLTANTNPNVACKNMHNSDLSNKSSYWSNQEEKDILVHGDKNSGSCHGAVVCAHSSEDDSTSTCSRIGSGSLKNNTVSALKENSFVWCLSVDDKWTLGRIECIADGETAVRTEDGQLLKCHTVTILPANPHVLDGVDDLRQLCYINEPSVLHNLQYRYALGKAYTEAGPLLISVNPFDKSLLHTDDSAQFYKMGNTEPHIYKTAATAFKILLEGGMSQSIIMSGESGSGKTRRANLAMQYLVSLGSNDNVKIKILEVNRILEAFGNAKTLINDNSSRFAKLIDIYFNEHGNAYGTMVQTCLLEKSRVVHRAKGEYSFHIFYQICSSLDRDLQEHLNLRPAREFKFLTQSECIVLDNGDDQACFDLTMEAMETLKFSKQDKESLFRLLSAILWLGNIKFSVYDNDNHASVVDDIAVETAARLLNCDKEHLETIFSTRKLQGDHLQKLTYHQAVCSRNALAMAIYGFLFDWLVNHMNKLMEIDDFCMRKSISILDMCGFETNERNSLQQIWINYANERLWQFFGKHCFEVEQKIYNSEGIDVVHIEFAPNHDAVELFEKGLFSVLDEASILPDYNDLDLSYKLKEKLVGNRLLKAEGENGFQIHHYAREVFYEVTDLLEKNRALLLSDLQQPMISCELQLPWSFIANINQNTEKPITSGQKIDAKLQQQSFTSQLQVQISKFLEQLEKTTAHFVYCIKPNTIQMPGLYEQDIVLQQLWCYRVLDIVRMSRTGYPIRLSHQTFASRFGFLLPCRLAVKSDHLSVCVAVLRQFNLPLDMYQVGYTKLFFREGQIEKLEDYRWRILHGIICIQKLYRGYKSRCHLKQLRRVTSLLQSLFRKQLIRKEVHAKKQLKEVATADKSTLITNETCNPSSVAENGTLHESSVTESKVELETETTVKILPSLVVDLEKRILVAEARALEKENNNALLQHQLDEYEKRLTEYQEKVKYLEEKWQKQLLQSSISAVEENLEAEVSTSQTIKPDPSSSPQLTQQITKPSSTDIANGVNIDIMSLMDTKLPEQKQNLALCSPSVHSHDISCRREEQDDGRAIVIQLTKELEHRTQVFKDDAEFLVEVKSGKSQALLNPEEELLKLSKHFHMWKKDFKIRLHETKKILQKLGKMQSASKKRKWWRRVN